MLKAIDLGSVSQYDWLLSSMNIDVPTAGAQYDTEVRSLVLEVCTEKYK